MKNLVIYMHMRIPQLIHHSQVREMYQTQTMMAWTSELNGTDKTCINSFSAKIHRNASYARLRRLE
jgi:hypothetical protein